LGGNAIGFGQGGAPVQGPNLRLQVQNFAAHGMAGPFFTPFFKERWMEPEVKTTTIAETEEYLAWKAEEMDETTYYLQLNNVTINFFDKEWASFIDFLRLLIKENDKLGKG